MKIKLDGENGIFLLSDETGVKIYNIGEIENEFFFIYTWTVFLKFLKTQRYPKTTAVPMNSTIILKISFEIL